VANSFDNSSNILSLNTISGIIMPFYFRIMKNRRNIKSKGNTKFVKINNSTWIEIDAMIPDEVARIQFLQKTETTKTATYLGQLKDYVSNMRT